MRTVPLDVLERSCLRLTFGSRVVVGGNFASPLAAVGALDRALEEYRLYALNAQPGLPTRAGVVQRRRSSGPG